MCALYCLGDQFMPKMWIFTLGAAHSSTASIAAPRQGHVRGGGQLPTVRLSSRVQGLKESILIND